MRFLSGVLGLMLAALAVACTGDDEVIVDAAPAVDARPALDAGPDANPFPYPTTVMPLLPARDVGVPFDTSVEANVVARGGTVVVSYINLHLGTDSWMDVVYDKRVGLAVSHDGGTTFGPAIDPLPLSPAWTTDPVLVGHSDGRFFLAVLQDTPSEFLPAIVASTAGDEWSVIVSETVFDGDKEWLAIDEVLGRLLLACAGGYRAYGFDGTLLAESLLMPTQMASAFAAGGVGHFLQMPPGISFDASQVVTWDGMTDPVASGLPLPLGDAANIFTSTGMSLGALADGGDWIVYAPRAAAGAPSPVVVRVRHLPADDGVDLPVSPPGDIAFLPTATLAPDGVLHVAWYDSSGASGVVKYAHSMSASFADGFTPPIVLDSNAVPGGFYPFYLTQEGEGGRRLREYIGIAVDGTRVHVVWTHAPGPPSRVVHAYVDL